MYPPVRWEGGRSPGRPAPICAWRSTVDRWILRAVSASVHQRPRLQITHDRAVRIVLRTERMEFDDGSLAKNPVSERLTARGARSIPVLDERSMTQNSEAALTPLRPPSPAPHQNRIYNAPPSPTGGVCALWDPPPFMTGMVVAPCQHRTSASAPASRASLHERCRPRPSPAGFPPASSVRLSQTASRPRRTLPRAPAR